MVINIQTILETPGKLDPEIQASIKQLRQATLESVVPPSFRALLWKVFLGVKPEKPVRLGLLSTDDTDDFGPGFRSSPAKVGVIDDDVKRTAPNTSFNQYARLSRILHWAIPEADYRQGMNAVCAVLVSCLESDCDVVAILNSIIHQQCPTYFTPSLSGAHEACALVDKILAIVDPELAFHLKQCEMTATLYAFPSALTLSACVQPMSEIIKLWDIYFAFGVHMNILTIIVQVRTIRTAILESNAPLRLLSPMPCLNTTQIIGESLKILKQIPPDVYEDLIRHPFTTL